MGKIYDSLLSGTSGRTGRIVVANMFGNEFTKIRPRKRTSAPSAKQLLIYQRMRLSAEFMQSYRPYACNHFGRRIGMKSCYNLAMTNLMMAMRLQTVSRGWDPRDFAVVPYGGGGAMYACDLAREIGACYAGLYFVVNYGEGVQKEWSHDTMKDIFYNDAPMIGEIILDTIRSVDAHERECECLGLRKETLLKDDYDNISDKG